MPIRIEDFGIDRLSVADRLDLIEQIWDSLPDDIAPCEIPAWHIPILERRLAEAEANPWRRHSLIAKLSICCSRSDDRNRGSDDETESRESRSFHSRRS